MKACALLLAGATALAPAPTTMSKKPALHYKVAAAATASAPLAAMAFEFPTLVAPKESQLPFTSAPFIAFFILSITGGLPFLAWLRLSSLEEDDDAPFDINGVARSQGINLPSLPSLPGLPNIPKVREIDIPDAVADKVGAKKSADLIDLLPWNRPDFPFQVDKGSGK